jgi:hypothetical protein
VTGRAPAAALRPLAPAVGSSGGASRLHTGMAWGQRGWKRQPVGGRARSGTLPSIETRIGLGVARSRTPASRPWVYGCRGRAKSSSTGASSAMRPAYMT